MTTGTRTHMKMTAFETTATVVTTTTMMRMIIRTQPDIHTITVTVIPTCRPVPTALLSRGGRCFC